MKRIASDYAAQIMIGSIWLDICTLIICCLHRHVQGDDDWMWVTQISTLSADARHTHSGQYDTSCLVASVGAGQRQSGVLVLVRHVVDVGLVLQQNLAHFQMTSGTSQDQRRQPYTPQDRKWVKPLHITGQERQDRSQINSTQQTAIHGKDRQCERNQWVYRVRL